MKKILIAVALSFSTIHSFAQYDTKDKKVNYFLSLAKKYSLDSYEILKRDKGFTVWMSGESAAELTPDFGVAVHETLHGLDFKLCTNSFQNGHAYLLEKNILIQLTMDGKFDTQKIDSSLPSEIKKKIGRYDTYVGKEAQYDMDSRKNGIYGLLEEYNAYCHGAKAVLDLVKNDVPIMSGRFKGGTTNDFEAFYEFNYLIAHYLLYAKKHRPEDYKKVINNKKLKVLYTLVTKRFEELIADVKKQGLVSSSSSGTADMSAMMEYMKKHGKKVVKKDKDGNEYTTYEISSKDGNIDFDELSKIETSNTKNTVDQAKNKVAYFSLELDKILGSNEKEILKLITIPSLTKENYKKYLLEH